MRYHALAADYDGTLATHGRIDDATWDALRRLRESGRKLITRCSRWPSAASPSRTRCPR
jgi:hydroxymethylpyrimidine pyrophosphatase-like HAD family hydrolase